MPTLEEATTYFTTHMDKAIWEEAGEEKQTALLTTAEAEINSLPLKPTITDEIKNKAIFEQAIFRLKYGDKRESLKAQGVNMMGITGGFYEHYNVYLVYGVALAPRAKLFLTGWFQVGAII
jgi:hypothetical protein